MKKELQEYLFKRFPQIFDEDKAGRPLSTVIEVGDGWFHIINNLCRQIMAHKESVIRTNKFNADWVEKIQNKETVSNWIQESYDSGGLTINPVPNVVAIQIKEKFGTLRFNCSGFDEYVKGLIGMAFEMSETTCEECGKLGHIRSGGWIRVLCDEHAEKNEVEPIAVGSLLKVLMHGEEVNLEILEVINDSEVKGKLIFTTEYGSLRKKEENESNQFFIAKYLANDVFSYWNAEKIDI